MVTIRVPSRLNARLRRVFALSSTSSVPVLASQILTVLAALLAVAIRAPSGLNDTPVIQSAPGVWKVAKWPLIQGYKRQQPGPQGGSFGSQVMGRDPASERGLAGTLKSRSTFAV